MTTAVHSDDAPPRQREHRLARRRWTVPLAVAAVGLLIAYAAASSYIKHRLEASIARKTDAQLTLKRLFYVPPYGVWIGSARIARGENFIIDFGSVSLTLAKLPFGGGPLLIERFLIDEPVVKLTRSADGSFGWDVDDGVPPGPPRPETKPSDLFRLRKFRIDRGRVEFHDRVNGNRVPSVWRNINVDIDTAPKGPAAYEFAFTARNGVMAELKASGDANIDEAIVDIDNLAIRVVAQPDAPDNPLPGPVQDLLRRYQVRGAVAFTGQGHVPLRALAHSTYTASLELTDAAVHVPQWDVTIDPVHAKFTMSGEPRPIPATQPGRAIALARASDSDSMATTAPASTQPAATQPTHAPGLNVVLDTFHAGSGRSSLNFVGAKIAVDPSTAGWRVTEAAGYVDFDGEAPRKTRKIADALEKWRLGGSIDFALAADGPLDVPEGTRLRDTVRHEVLLYPRALDVQPPKFPHLLEDIGGGSMRLANGVATFQNLSAMYGKDRWLLNSARLSLDALPRFVRITDIQGAIEFQQPSHPYPRPLTKTVAALNPAGPFLVGGSYLLDLDAPRNEEGKRVPVLDLMISSDRGAFALTDKRVAIIDIRGDALLRYGELDIRRFNANVLGGTMAARAQFRTVKPRAFTGKASLREIDLEQVGRTFIVAEDDDRKLSGRGFANLQLSGSLEPNERKTSLAGGGELEIIEGALFEVPVLRDVIQVVGGKPSEATVSQASATFAIRDGQVHIPAAAVSAAAIGLQGGGRVGLDSMLDLDIVVAPLADWRDRLKQTNIPIVSDVTGELAGAIQRMLNAATRGLLYEFRVTGKLGAPRISAVPAPVLSEARAVIFGDMLTSPKRPPLEQAVPAREE